MTDFPTLSNTVNSWEFEANTVIGNKEILSKWMGRQCKYHAHFTSLEAARDFEKGIKQESLVNTQGWTLYLNWSDKKVRTKN